MSKIDKDSIINKTTMIWHLDIVSDSIEAYNEGDYKKADLLARYALIGKMDEISQAIWDIELQVSDR